MDFATYKVIYEMDVRLKKVEELVNSIWAIVQIGQQKETEIMASVQDVVAKVAEVQGAADSTIELLDQVHVMLLDARAQLAQNGVDTAALDTVMSTLQTNKQHLGDAVERNPLPA